MWSDTVVGVLKHVWFLSRLFFLCPRPIDERMTSKQSLFQKIYIVVYNVIAIFVTTYMVYASSTLKISDEFNVVTQLADLIFNVSNNISAVVTVFFCLVHQKTLTRVVQRLDDIDTKLKQSFKWKSYKNTQIFITTQLLFVVGLWLSFLVNFMWHCPSWRCFYRWVILYTSTKMSQVMLMEFCAFVVVLKQKLYVINENLKEISKDGNQSAIITHVLYKETLNKMEILHNKILVVYGEIQSIFSVPLLMKIASQFIGIFCSLYFCIFGYISDDRFVDPQNFHDVLLPLLAVLVSSVEIATTVAACEYVSLEYKRTKKLLYRIPVAKGDALLIKRVRQQL